MAYFFTFFTALFVLQSCVTQYTYVKGISCTNGTLVEGTYCLCNADTTLVTPVTGTDYVCSSIPFENAGCPSASIINNALSTVNDTLSISGARVNIDGAFMVVTLEQPRLLKRAITSVSLGSCQFSADNLSPSTGTGTLVMLNANGTTCTQSFELEFKWTTCMENQTSMTREEYGDYWKYSGYMSIDVTTPILVGGLFPDFQRQSLARAVAFLAPKTITIDMGAQTLRIWNRELVLPILDFSTATWGQGAFMTSTIFLTSRIINPWTFSASSDVKPVVSIPSNAASSSGSTDVATGPIRPGSVCNNGAVDAGSCSQTLSFQVQSNGFCDISGVYAFTNVPIDCQASELMDCPANFLTNFQLDLTAPITCADVSRSLTSSTGGSVIIQTTLRKPGVDDPTASFDYGGKVIIDYNVTTPDVYLGGLKTIVRYISQTCANGQYLNIPATDYSVIFGVDLKTATITVNLTRLVTCDQTDAKLTILPSWILNTTSTSRRSIPGRPARSINRRDDETVNSPGELNVGNGGANSFVYGIANTPLVGDYAITDITIRTGATATSTIELTAALEGPYMFSTTAGGSLISVNSSYSPIPFPRNITISGGSLCSNNTTCTQTIRFDIDHENACRLDGVYSLMKLPVTCQPDLPVGVDCANTMWAAQVTLEGIDLCARAEYTMENIWGLDIASKDGGRKAMIYNTSMDMELTITKLKEFGQYIYALNLTNVTRVIPSSSNENCTTPTDVTDAIQFSYQSPQMTANLTLTANQLVVCEIPDRGTARGVQLTFTFDFEYGFSNVDARRRRRTIQARQSFDTSLVMGNMRPSINFDVYATEEDMRNNNTPSSSNTLHGISTVLHIILIVVSVLLL